jgi:hypothetical protein
LQSALGFDQLSEQQLLATKTLSLCNWLNNPKEPPMQSFSMTLVDAVNSQATKAHGLSAAPNYVRLALVCTSNDPASGLVIGDELDLGAGNPSDFADEAVNFSAICNSTNIILTYTGRPGNNSAVAAKSGFSEFFTSFSNFTLKAYYNLFP